MPYKNAERRKAYMKKRRAEKPEFHRASVKKHRDKNPEQHKIRTNKYVSSEKGQKQRKAYNLMKNYGLTVDQFEEMLMKQNNRCAICSIHISDSRAHTDHCHETGKVRGLLCHLCNKALGLFNDDSNILRQAIKYLKG